jgi:hypothetical protein
MELRQRILDYTYDTSAFYLPGYGETCDLMSESMKDYEHWGQKLRWVHERLDADLEWVED